MPSLIPLARQGMVLTILLLLSACNQPVETIREIEKNLEIFKAKPNMVTLEALDKSFDKIQTQIDALQAEGDTVQADLYRRQAFTLRYEYRAVRREFIRWSNEQLKKKTKPSLD
ncbi:MAG: hypothetical protein RL630_2020 [Verrucomicrobiota bacterium]|jgi:hypothetical protein